jgi:hypothetical protein
MHFLWWKPELNVNFRLPIEYGVAYRCEMLPALTGCSTRLTSAQVVDMVYTQSYAKSIR